MKKRLIVILEYLLNRDDYITSTLLANHFHVSNRTIKTCVKKINDYYQRALIISSPQGYRIDYKVYDEIKNEINVIPQDHEERTSYILKKLLLEESHLNIYELSDNLFISESTLKTTISRMNKTYANFNIRFLVQNDEINVIGNEQNKRRLISNCIFEETSSKLLDLSIIKKYFPSFDSEEVKGAILSIFQAHEVYIDDFSLMNLILHLFININRVIDGNYLKNDYSNVHENIQQSNLIDDLCHYLEYEFQIKLSEYERKEIQILILANSSFHFEKYNDVIQEELIHLSVNIAKKIQEHYVVNLNKESFLIPFSLHLKKLVVRLKEGILAKNLLIEDMKHRFPIIYDMAVFASIQIQYENNYSQPLNETEITYIALHIGAELERQKTEMPKLKAALLCPKYIGFQEQLYHQLLNQFHNELSLLPPIAYEEELEKLDFDILFTTVPIQKSLKTQVSIRLPIISEDINRLQILSLIDQVKKERKQEILRSRFHQYFYDDLFNIFNNKTSKDDVLKFLCKELKRKDYINDDFIEALYEREAACATSFTDFAIPHSIKMNALQSCISVYISENGIYWNEDNKNVHIVFLIAINKVDIIVFASLYEALIDLLNNKQTINSLKKCKSFEEFKKIIFNEL